MNVDVILISKRNPIKVFTDKLISFEKNKFEKKNCRVLTLGEDIDMLIVNDMLYMFSDKSESFLSMERTYNKKCDEVLDKIGELQLVNNMEKLIEIGKKGHNPRGFVSYNEESLNILKDPQRNSMIVNKFGVKVQEGMIQIDTDEDAKNLIKLLCNKGALNPFNGNAIEVKSAKKWN